MMRILRFMISVMLLPFAIIIGLVVAIVLGGMIALHLPSMLLENHRWRRKLSLANRLNQTKSFRDQLATGTLIIDSPTLGRGLLQCWWTADDIPSLSPMPEPTDADRYELLRSNPDALPLAWDRWIANTYLDRGGGKGILIATRYGDRIAERITAQSSAIHVVRSWSAHVYFATQAGSTE